MNHLKTVLFAILGLQRVLWKHLGFRWPAMLLKAFANSGKLIDQTRWKEDPSEEAEYLKLIAVFAALYLDLLMKFPEEKARRIQREIMETAVLNDDMIASRQCGLLDTVDPFRRFQQFNKHLSQEGSGKFNHLIFYSREPHEIHYLQTRCLFHDFFTEVGLPELTRYFCNIDRVIYQKIFPEYHFNRNGNWANTLGYGAPQCEFVFLLKDRPDIEFEEEPTEVMLPLVTQGI